MSLSEAIATQATWIQIWVGWLAVINIAALAALLIKPASRRHGLVVGAAFISNYLLMNWLYAQYGFSRILGLSHIVIWGPLMIYLMAALRGASITDWRRPLTYAFVFSMSVSLAFDIIDVTRWVMGARGSLLPAGSG
ncbi:MAG: hypothetical protein AAFZ04_06665 [Pseudomonadota bacterium]